MPAERSNLNHNFWPQRRLRMENDEKRESKFVYLSVLERFYVSIAHSPGIGTQGSMQLLLHTLWCPYCFRYVSETGADERI